MIVYNTPTLEAFHCRKKFHGIQKAQNENIHDWFKRLQKSISNCDFDRIADYILIDKFVSGISENDFEKISQVSTWTMDELILVVIGNPHVFKCNQENQNQFEVVEFIKTNEHLNSEVENEEIDSDNFIEEPNACSELIDANNDVDVDNVELVTIDKKDLNAWGKSKKHIEKLKENGKYDEYKRKKAEWAKNRRLLVKNNEQYLPPELQLHLTTERRRATRERVNRWRERKHQKPQETIKIKIESVQSKGTANKRITARKLSPPKKITFECYLCLMKCNKLNELKTHLTIFHPLQQKEMLSCMHCSKTTISPEVLSRHLKKCHGGFQVHKCPCCDTEFTKRGQLTDHLASHPNYRPFICETCGNTFKRIQELNSHLRKHTGEKRFKCGVCDMLLVSSSSYRSHMLTHTGERPYPCNICGKDFRQVSSLRKHLISIHNQGEKPFLCTTCNKRFASTYHLRIHSNVHTGERPYRCQYCDSTFSQPSALRAHNKRIHENHQ